MKSFTVVAGGGVIEVVSDLAVLSPGCSLNIHGGR